MILKFIQSFLKTCHVHFPSCRSELKMEKFGEVDFTILLPITVRPPFTAGQGLTKWKATPT
jgi:hypothetical protein